MQKNSLDITINGYFHPRGGWGIFNWNLTEVLQSAGVDVYIRPTIPLSQFKDFLSHEQTMMINKPIKKTDIGLYVVEPWARLSGMTEKVQIAYSMVESDAIGAGWLATLNSMDAVIVPNNFIKNVFEKCGVTKPIHVIFPYVNTKMFPPHTPKAPRGLFTFGLSGYMDDRKSALEVIQAFVSEFRTEKDVRLMIHSTNTDFGFYKALKDPRITISTKPLKYSDIPSFYHSIDCYLAPSKGEGIGMTVLEAMSSGVPVIGTKWGGLTDVITEDNGFPLTEYELKPRPLMIEQPGNWAYPDIQEIMYQMRYAYEHQYECLAKGIAASCFIQEYFNEELVGNEFIKVLKQYEAS